MFLFEAFRFLLRKPAILIVPSFFSDLVSVRVPVQIMSMSTVKYFETVEYYKVCPLSLKSQTMVSMILCRRACCISAGGIIFPIIFPSLLRCSGCSGAIPCGTLLVVGVTLDWVPGYVEK